MCPAQVLWCMSVLSPCLVSPIHFLSFLYFLQPHTQGIMCACLCMCVCVFVCVFLYWCFCFRYYSQFGSVIITCHLKNTSLFIVLFPPPRINSATRFNNKQHWKILMENVCVYKNVISLIVYICMWQSVFILKYTWVNVSLPASSTFGDWVALISLCTEPPWGLKVNMSSPGSTLQCAGCHADACSSHRCF